MFLNFRKTIKLLLEDNPSIVWVLCGKSAHKYEDYLPKHNIIKLPYLKMNNQSIDISEYKLYEEVSNIFKSQGKDAFYEIP